MPQRNQKPTSNSAIALGFKQTELIQTKSDGSSHPLTDLVAVEEPLEIRLAGEPFIVTMRTPGSDHELVAGLLLSEGIIHSALELGSIVHCGRMDDEGYGNTIDVLPAAGTAFTLDEDRELKRRGTLVSSACGVCGRRSIDDLLRDSSILDDTLRISPKLVSKLSESLRNEQPNFSRTGGLHAAGIAKADGTFAVVREDVGRHNAVDKAIGRLLLDQTLNLGQILVVSGRSSFEILLKAVRARISIVIGISAPSSLAIETAARAQVTLIGFSRAGEFNVYAHPERLVSAGD